VHRLVRTTATKPDIYRLRGEWVDIDPRSWNNRKDLTVSVGLGTGNKDMQLQHIQTILGAQKDIGGPIGIVSPQNTYNALVKLTQNAGFRNPEEFWTDPTGKPPPPPPKDPKLQVTEMTLQADAQKFQAQSQMEQQKYQAEVTVEQQKFQAETHLEQMKFQAEAELAQQEARMKYEYEQKRSENDIIIEREKLQMTAELEKFKAELQAQTQLQIAQMQAEVNARQAIQDAALKQQDQAMQMQMHSEKMDAMMKAKTVKRDEQGRVSGIE